MNALHYLRHAALGALMILAGGIAAHAQSTLLSPDVPRTISYQGLLSSPDGAVLPDGAYQVTVALYSDPQGSREVWRDSYTTQVTAGVFNLYLGQGRPLPEPGSISMPLWIGTSVDGGAEMRPLTPLSASPYALNVPDASITTAKVADGAITSEKIDMDYVAELQVDGEKISAKGTVLNLVSTPAVPLNYDEQTQSLTIGKMPAITSDGEKNASVLAGGPIVWSVNGDGYDVSTATGYTPAAGDWIGTQGGTDFLVQVSSTQVMNYQVSGVGVPNMIGGDVSNTITAASVQGSIIAEGRSNTINIGDYNAISGGQNNTVASAGAAVSWAAIGGGENNVADGDHATVGGGINNQALSTTSTISGGGDNTIGTGVFLATIGGGGGNNVTAPEATIAGGHRNQVHAYVSAVGGGHDNYIRRQSDFSVIAGGLLNAIGEPSANPFATHSTIGGGQQNRIGVTGSGTITHAFVGGGQDNELTASHTTIGGGLSGQIHSYAATIGGGESNFIGDASQWAFIGGGQANNLNADHGVIGGGETNVVSAVHSTVGGGWDNVVSGTESTIGGGQNNQVTARWGTIAGGANNGVTADMGTVGGGENNQVTAPEATISGGHRNQVHAYVSVVSGGHNNFIWRNSTHSGIGSGLLNNVGNTLTSPPVTHSHISGGESNGIGTTGATQVDHSYIGGGQSNLINTAAGLPISHATISGGQGNRTEASTSTIGGGLTNTITVAGRMATIGGGAENTITAAEATIAGGHRNRVDSYVSAIGGGHDGRITANSNAGFIGGGYTNTVDAPFATIGGGQENTARGTHTTIPGGDRLTTNPSYAQSAMGFFDAPRGAMGFRPNAATIAASNDPLFIIGNGDVNANLPSNAFEVSYNGHSTVYGVNGSGTVNPSILGATYVDNVIYAWGEIDAGGAINADFGVSNVTPYGGGVYDVTINVTDPLGNPVTLTQASITVTIVDDAGDYGCAVVTASRIGVPAPNTFTVRTYMNNGECRPEDLPFMFKVTGRP